jgi:hypothetical protein
MVLGSGSSSNFALGPPRFTKLDVFALRQPRFLQDENRKAIFDPSPSSRWNSGLSWGVEMTRMSRIPASISVDSG